MRKSIFFGLFLLSLSAHGQVLSSINFKTGFTYSGQIKSPSISGDGGEKVGFSFTIEPTLESFGSKNKFHLHLALTYAQKGGYNTSPVYAYNQLGQIVGEGSESYAITQNYFAISPTFSFDYGEKFYVKIGPRIDVFTGFRSGARFSLDNRKKEDFSKYNYGATAAIGYVGGSLEDKTQFTFEIVGQPDFTVSTTNPATSQEMTNFSFLFNFGFRVNITPVVIE